MKNFSTLLKMSTTAWLVLTIILETLCILWFYKLYSSHDLSVLKNTPVMIITCKNKTWQKVI